MGTKIIGVVPNVKRPESENVCWCILSLINMKYIFFANHFPYFGNREWLGKLTLVGGVSLCLCLFYQHRYSADDDEFTFLTLSKDFCNVCVYSIFRNSELSEKIF